MKRLFIIDAMAMAFRNYHAFGVRPLTTSKGLPTSAVYGSAMFLLKLIEEEKPDYLVVATDSREPTFRHALYPAYKANRTEMPADLATQIPYLFRLFQALDCRLLKHGGVEADDLIGSLVHQFKSPDLHCYIVSGDKDFMQLVDASTFLYSPKKGAPAEVVGRAGVFEKWGCNPEQMIDILALIGDSSDNVPGVPGIGEKSAAQLIQKFGSLDNIYKHLDDIMNARQREGLQNNREQAYLSRQLITIDVNLPLQFTLSEMTYDASTALARTELLEFCKELEFRTLVTKLSDRILAKHQAGSMPTLSDARPAFVLGASEVSKEALPFKSAADFKHDYHVVSTADALRKLCEILRQAPHFAFDTETTGLNKISDRPIGLSFAVAEGQAFYVPIAPQHCTELSAEEVLQRLAPILGNSSQEKVGHNIKFDLQMLANVGVKVAGPFFDTMIASHLLDASGREHGLDASCLRYLKYKKIPTAQLIGPKATISMLDVPLEQLTEYACEDADFTLRLRGCFAPKLQAIGAEKVFRELEMPLVQVLADIEQNGIFVDSDVLAEISDDLAKRATALTTQIYGLAGEEFNINSTRQLGTILFEKLKIHEQLKITRIKKTQSGFSTDVSVLEKLSEHPLPRAILEYRTVTKLKNTYVDTLPQLINPKTQRIHTNFHQTGTATGRLSSSDPNLQNIPVRSDLGREIRKAFRAQSRNNVIISADYSQIELRLLAHMAKEANLAQAFANGEDIHTATAARIFGLPVQEVSSLRRSQAKAINFGIIYGMGPQRLARQTGVSMAEAKLFIEKYFASYPGIATYIDRSIALARQFGFTTTITGRRRPLPEIYAKDSMTLANAENIAVNSPVQGSAADLIKLAMVKIDTQLHNSKLKAKMLLQVHDELVFECPREEADTVSELIRDAMQNAMTLDVPLLVELERGDNWLEAH